MKFKLLLVMIPALLAAATAPAISQKSSVNPANAREASDLLRDVRLGALEINDDASEIGQFASDSNIDWQTHAAKLTEIRDQINDMGHSLDVLQAIQAAALPWQRDALERTVPLVRLMAGNVTAAINYLSRNKEYLFNSQYGLYQANLVKQSKELGDMLRDFEELANDQQKDTQIRKKLGIDNHD